MKIYLKKYFKFNRKNLFCLLCLFTFISCASNTKLNELQNPENQENIVQSEQENLNFENLNSDNENLGENSSENSNSEENLAENSQNNLEKSQENQTLLSNQEYPEIEILKDEPNVFDEPVQDPSENQSETQNIQELDSDINPYFESDENNLNNSNPQTEILTESEELPKDISEFYSQENDASLNENPTLENLLNENQNQETNNSIKENPENSQTLTSETNENQEILIPENQENLEENQNENLSYGLEEVPTVEEINSFDETNLAQESFDNENKVDSEQNEIPIASRTLTMKQNQFLEVHYPGSGWIYLGEEDSKSLMRYMGRKIGTSDTIFTLRSRSQGTTLLHFYKNDALTGNFIDDYLEVQIKGKATDSQIAIAPSYEEIVPRRFNSASSDSDLADSSSDLTVNSSNKSATSSSELSDSSLKTANSSVPSESSFASSENSSTQATNSSSASSSNQSATSQSQSSETSTQEPSSSSSAENSSNQTSASPEEILKLAKTSYNNKNYSQSLNYVNEFLSVSNTKLDEALFLKGQILESASEVQNIKEALNAYENLVKSYPKSSYWKRASERATYIKRFYFNIR